MFRTKVILTVLSEEPIDDLDLDSIAYEANTGDLVLDLEMEPFERLNGKEMADALYSVGSEPGFFQLDDDGNPTD